MAEIKDRIIFLRQKKEMNQKELADKLNISASTIGMIEQGRRKPSFDLLEEICDFFNVDMDYLIGRSDIPNKVKAGINYDWEKNSLDHCSIDDVSNEEFYLVEHDGKMIKFYIKELSPEERIELTNNKKGTLAFNDKISKEDMTLLENVLAEMYLKSKLGK